MDSNAICIGCGCTDWDGCQSTCYWIVVDYEKKVGVCSNCGEYLEKFHKKMAKSISIQKNQPKISDKHLIKITGEYNGIVFSHSHDVLLLEEGFHLIDELSVYLPIFEEKILAKRKEEDLK